VRTRSQTMTMLVHVGLVHATTLNGLPVLKTSSHGLTLQEIISICVDDLTADDCGVYGCHSSPSVEAEVDVDDDGVLGSNYIVKTKDTSNLFEKPHGCSKKSKEPYIRTKPSVMEKIRELGQKGSANTFIQSHLAQCHGKNSWKMPDCHRFSRSNWMDLTWALGRIVQPTVIGYCPMINVLGKKYQNSGLEDVLIESGAYGSGSVMVLMKGKSYNRGVRAHKLVMEALFRLMWQSFLHWLNGGGMESQEQIVDEEHITDSIKSFRLAVQNKDHVPQSAKATMSELFTLMELFEVFRQEQKSRLKIYIRNDMEQLEKNNPVVYNQFQDGGHAVNCSSQPFAKVWTDMALEQSINLDSKSKGGIIGISQNPDALQRWFLTIHERSAITTVVKQMCGINDLDRVGTRKEAARKRVERDEKDVEKIVACLKSVPYSLAHSDGTHRKTAKSVLLQILGNYVTVESRLTSIPGIATVYILDGMALVQMMKFAGVTTFGEMAVKYYEDF
ncbi:Hypothetical predicted protein, partial [Paramuricea clavata]